MLVLAPDVEKTVLESAQKEGLSPSDFVARLLHAQTQVQTPTPKTLDIAPDTIPNAAPFIRRGPTDDEKRAPVLEYINLSREETRKRNAPSIARLREKIAEAENATPEEIAEAEAEWLDFKRSLNENRLP